MDTISESIDLKNYKPVKSVNTITESDETGTGDSYDAATIKWNDEANSHYSFIPNQKTTVFDVADYILDKVGAMTTMKLHKLVYYSQAWSLVWDEEPLFSEKIEAWSNGPVIRELFAYHRGNYSISKVQIGNSNILTEKQKQTIDAVIDYYASKPPQWLISLSHMEEPWKKARIGLSPTERGHNEITLESMAEYYSSL